YSSERLDAQLDEIAKEIADRREMIFVDRGSNQLTVNPMFSWREQAFIASYADKAPKAFASRSPLERAVLALIEPLLKPSETEFLAQNQFRMAFGDFDWRLNDLTGRGR